MKKCLSLIGGIFTLLIGFTGCDFSGVGTSIISEQLGSTKIFYTIDEENNSFNSNIASLVAVGNYCRVWFIDQNYAFINLESSNFSEVAEKFDSLYAKETAIFGSNVPEIQYNNIISVKSNDKIDILVFDIDNDAYENQSGGTFGYFYRNDMITNEWFRNQKELGNISDDIKSNEKEIFYIDSYFLAKDPNSIYSTLAHEFQHMLHFIEKSLNQNANGASETWYNEMLSLCAEELMQKTLGIGDEYSPKSRLRWTNVGSSNGFSNIFHLQNVSGSFDYGNAYYLGTYLMHNYGGVNIIRKIAKNNKRNAASIVNALIESNSDITSFNSLIMRYGKNMADGYLPSLDVNGYNLDKITFSNYPIRITNYNSTIQAMVQGNSSNLAYGTSAFPYYYKADAQIALKPTGFSVHSLGTINTSSFTINLTPPSNDNLKVIFYCNGFIEDVTSISDYSFDSSNYIGKEAFLIKSNIGNEEINASETGICTNSIIYSKNVDIFKNFFISEYNEPKYIRIDKNFDNDEIMDIFFSNLK